MMEEEVEKILDYRIALLESLLIPTEAPNEQGTILERVDRLQSSINQFENEVPDLKPCVEMLQKITPLLNQKKLNMQDLVAQIQVHLLRKDEIMKMCDELRTIKDLEHFIDGSQYEGGLRTSS